MRLSTTVLNVPEELGVRSRPRVPLDETEMVQAPVMLTLTSVVSVPQMSEAELPDTVPFIHSIAPLLSTGERILATAKAIRNENSPVESQRTRIVLFLLSIELLA
ncbi:hypothetical protein IJI55_00565 [Candidatus Saccharibacteria bacterium]|nr:hypothetical protein [Candidatus Saccharibacteria bacterium]